MEWNCKSVSHLKILANPFHFLNEKRPDKIIMNTGAKNTTITVSMLIILYCKKIIDNSIRKSEI